MPSDAAPLTTEFDREHLRLLTDKLSEKAGDLRTANARLRALINIGLELASERDSDRLLQSVCVAARDLFGATYVTLGIVDRNDRTVQRFVTCGADARRLDQDRRRGLGDPRHGRRRATDAAWRQSWRRSGRAAASRRSIRRFRHSWPHPSRHRPMSTGGSVSSATRAGPSPRTTNTWSWRCRGRSAASTRTAISMRSRRSGPKSSNTRSRAQTGGGGAAPRAGPGAAIPGHGRSHPARAGPGRADHADQPQGLRPPRMDRARVARARLDRDLPAGPTADRRHGERFARARSAAISPSSRTRSSRRSGEERLIEWRNTVLRDDDGTRHRHVQFRHRHHRAASGGRGAANGGRAHAVCAGGAGVGIWDMDYTTGCCGGPRSSKPSTACSRARSAGPSRRSSSAFIPTIATSVLETLEKGHEVRRRFLDPEPIDLA